MSRIGLDARPEYAEQVRVLRRYKAVPLALLIIMAMGFVLSQRMPATTFQGYLAAFCEAAMVGALADWFAVTALFRRPLGLPIPHTAIIQNRKDELGAALAGFVQRHFLTRETVARRTGRMDLSGMAADWLRGREASEQVAGNVLSGLHWLLQAVDERPVREFLRREVDTAHVARYGAPMLGYLLAGLHRSGRHQPLLTEALAAARGLLQDHRGLLLGQAQSGSPWWVPQAVDRRLFAIMLDRVDVLIEEIVADPLHPLREEIDRGMLSLTQSLEQGDSDTLAALESMLDGCVDKTAVHDVLLTLWSGFRDYALAGSAPGARTVWQKRMAQYIRELAGRLTENEELRQLLNRWTQSLIETAVRDHGHEVGRLISDTVSGWDGRATARLIELQVGKDLQFIRINGTLVGGLIGLVIHFSAGWLAVGGSA